VPLAFFLVGLLLTVDDQFKFHFGSCSIFLFGCGTIFRALQKGLCFPAPANLVCQSLPLLCFKTLQTFNLFPNAFFLFFSCLRLDNNIPPNLFQFGKNSLFLHSARVRFCFNALQSFRRQTAFFFSSTTKNLSFFYSTVGLCLCGT